MASYPTLELSKTMELGPGWNTPMLSHRRKMLSHIIVDAKIGEAFADDEVGEVVAGRKRSKWATPGWDSVTDIRDVIGNRHAGQARTPLKRAPRRRLQASPYTGDAFADGDGCKVRAARES